ncbi:MAG: tetratricopeptide repeat protein, partial [Deltaproteobacteria bacterium]|nr:tetratricopeptide repeat protein [Deltaproteobacteria bacterium]
MVVLLLIAGTARAGVEDDLRDGDRYFEDGEWQKAASVFDRAIGKAPGQVPAAAYGKRATIFIIIKSYKAGLEFIARAKLRHPGAPEILEQEALILWETDRRDDAIVVAEQVVATRPETFTNQKLIGEHFAARDPVKTVAAFEAYLANRPVSLEPGDVLPRVRLGFAYLSLARTAIAGGDAKARDQYERAAVQFETVQRKHAGRPNAQVNADNGLCAAYTGLERFDEAVTVCERITRDPKRVDAAASAWFNLATAYLKRRNTKQARAAANEFVKLRKAESRGYLLLGDVLFENREWTAALEHYTRAEKLAKPDQVRERALISIGLGKTYRRLPAKNLPLAIEKLTVAYAANPASSELALELGGAHLEAKQDAKALALVEGLLAGPALTNATPATKASALVLAGKARFNLKELDKARDRFEEAQKLLPADVAIRRGLVLVINEQAVGKDGKVARTLLNQAAAIDRASPVTIANLAILSLANRECDASRTLLATLEGIRGHDSVLRLRLLARTHLCGPNPDPKRAAEAYAAAEKAARRMNAPVVLAEIFTEWAPLIWDTDVDDAIAKLEIAVKTVGQDPEIGPAARRNLALALYRRGWKRLREGKPGDAVSDFERARDPSVLRGTEASAFE